MGTRGIFLEREEGKLTLRRGFAIAPHEKVLVVEDIVTTGTSVFELLDALKQEKAEGRIVGVAYLVDRSGGKAQFGVPQEPLMRLDLPNWAADECPLCKQGVPLTKRGSRYMRPRRESRVSLKTAETITVGSELTRRPECGHPLGPAGRARLVRRASAVRFPGLGGRCLGRPELRPSSWPWAGPTW